MGFAISTVVMAFNEAGSLEKVVGEIDGALADMMRPYEIVIIDDGSTDGTEGIADRLAESNGSVRVIHHDTNGGLGAVYRTGFASAKGDLITFFPADGQFPAEIIKQFAPLMDDADMVLGYVPKGKRSPAAKFLSGAERMLFKLFFGRLPKFQGIMMFKKSLLDKFKLKAAGRGWTVVMELILRAEGQGCRLISVPTEIRSRMAGRSKVKNMANIWANLRQLIVLRRNFRRT
ncbi:glycosyltransferase [Candidatus Omnitrophota bacterium]